MAGSAGSIVRGVAATLTCSLAAIMLIALTARSVLAADLSGRWQVHSKCNTGTFRVRLFIEQVSAHRFSGWSRGLDTGAISDIFNGRISGNRVSFSRRAVTGFSYTEHSDAVLTRAGGRLKMQGQAKAALWTCRFTATKTHRAYRGKSAAKKPGATSNSTPKARRKAARKRGSPDTGNDVFDDCRRIALDAGLKGARARRAAVLCEGLSSD